MPINILMPALSPTMEKGNLAKWLKREGDAVKPGDILAEIETDKATMEVEAVDDGVLAKIIVPDGTADVAVNQLIGIIAIDGEDAVAAAKESAPGHKAAPVAAPSAPSPATAAVAGPAPQPAPSVQPFSARIFTSPLARRLAKAAGLDLAKLTGTGPHGRIIERDVKAAAASLGAPPSARAVLPAAPVVSAPPIPANADAAIRKLFEPGSFTEVPHDGMRKIIARRLVEAKTTIPHFYLSIDCQLDRLLASRETINAASPKGADGKPSYKISVNDFVIKALAAALMRVPDANVTWTETALLRHKHADVGVAVSIPGGLITPVIRRADSKPLAVISAEMKDLAQRARARKLMPEDYQGGSSAVSNLGMFGIRSFAAVINPPHATILAIGAGEERLIVRNGAGVVATMMSVTLSTDHRAVDGALGAQLLQAFKSFIEDPVTMLV